MKRFLLWLNQFLNTPITRPDMNDVLLPETSAAPVPVAPVVADPVPVAPAAPAAPSVNTDTLKALLLTLGHDVEEIWEHVVELAKKA
ncbi:hypothetical protein [Pseudomonas knackmussii]|uniref:hypothetical protein n=1 Tax=Pseudomonas knackmussii TaxID=65741 RepID=UPI003F4A4630